jgi:hypothetical protein
MNKRINFLKTDEEEYLGIPIRVERSLVDDILKQDIYNQETVTDPNGTYRQIETIVVDPSTSLETGDDKVTITIPFDGKLVGLHAFVSTASTSGIVDISLEDENGNDIGWLVIAANENGTEESNGQSAIDLNRNEYGRYNRIKVNIDAVGTGSKGLVIQLYFIVSKFYFN